jgi:hypothetical protein
MTDPPNNPLKLSFTTIAVVIISPCLIVLGIVGGNWLPIVVGVVGVIVLPLQIKAIRQGRNPWWSRAPMDYFYRRRRR